MTNTVVSSFSIVIFASAAGGAANCNTAAFASFKKYASLLFEFRLDGTEPKEMRLLQLLVKIRNRARKPFDDYQSV